MGDLFKETLKKKKGEEDIAELIKKELGVKKPAREEQEDESERGQEETSRVSTVNPKHLEDFESMVAATPDYDENAFDTAEKTVVAKYNEVTIYKIKGQPLLHYHVPAPKSTVSEQEIVDTIKEAATRLISIAPYKIRDEKQRRNVYFQKIMEIITSSPELRIPEGMINFYADAVVREMVGYGKIDLLLKDDLLEEIMIIGPLRPVFVFHRQYEMMTTNISFTGDKGIQDIIGRIARYAGRRVDYSQPLLDARLPDGSRVNATLPPASVSGSTLTIRKFREDPYTIIDLINYKTFDSDVGAFLWTCVDGLNAKPANIIISGGTGSGKTTLLNVLSALINPNERVISIEDTAELSLPLKHWIRLEARPPGIEGTGEITLEMLTKNALRMRPDRIIVGEVRSAEAEALFTAINTGHSGCLTSDTKIVFANGVEDIGKFVDCLLSSSDKNYKEGVWDVVPVKKKFVNSLNDAGKVVKTKVVEARRKKYLGEILKIKLSSGSEIKMTPNHPLYILDNNVKQIAAEKLLKHQYIATPRVLICDNIKDKETEYWSGLLHGDGNILDKKRFRIKNGHHYICNEGRFSLFTEDKTIIPKYKGFLKENLGDIYINVAPRPGCYKVRVSGIYSARSAQELLDMPAGSRQIGAISNSHFGSKNFVSGFFDAEGHVDANNNAFIFSGANENYVDFIRHSLLTSSIVSRKYKIVVPNSTYFTLYVQGLDNFKDFYKKHQIKYIKKVEKANEILKKQITPNSNVDVVPCKEILSNLIKLAKEKGISESKIAKVSKLPQSSLRAYRTGFRMPTPKQLNLVAVGLNKLGIKNNLSLLANSDVFWDKIVSIKKEKYSGYVYDLTVSEKKNTKTKPHNFVANGIFVGNSMGTLHANSAEETLVRITSPPMSVPQMMLAGLDMILIENRLHDRRRGTIRRLVEISEVINVVEGNPKIQRIFEWDPKKDKMYDTSIPSRVLKNISLYSGKSTQQVKDEIDYRRQFLDLLLEKNVRKKDDVAKYINKYYESQTQE